MGSPKWVNYSDEELLQMVKDLAAKLGRSPKQKEMRNENNVPSSEVYYKRFNTQAWNNILKIAGLEVNHFQGYTKEMALKNLVDYYNLLGKIPIREDFRKNKFTPNYDWYSQNFGSYKQACYEAGLSGKVYTDEEKIKIAIDELIKLANKLNRIPTCAEYKKVKHEGFTRGALEIKLKLKYNDICRKYLPQHTIVHNKDLPSKDELITQLIEIKNKIGRIPTVKEINQMSGLKYNISTYYTVFKTNSYNKILKEANLLEGYNYRRILKSDDEMLNDFYTLFKELRRIPTADEIVKNQEMVTYDTYNNRFGSIENVCKILAIDESYALNNYGAGKICFDKKGGFCKSKPEMNISNFFIDNNIDFLKETLYSEFFKNDGRKFDWKLFINNDVYYVEYFGMYNKKPRRNMDRNYKKKAKKKIKDLYKLGITDKCVFIFPNDLKIKTLKEIFEPVLNIKLKNIEFTDVKRVMSYACMSDSDLLEKIMKYSDNANILPSTQILMNNKCSGIYREITKRHGSYSNFAKSFNKTTPSNIFRPYKNIDGKVKFMEYVVNKYGRILSKKEYEELKNVDKNLIGGSEVYRKTIDMKLMFMEFMLTNNKNLEFMKHEISWLNNVVDNSGTGIKNRVSDEQQNRAKEILELIKNKELKEAI